MKTLFAILIILVSSFLCLAQSDTRQEPNWQPFAPDREEFSAEIPVTLKAAATLTRSANRNYRGQINGTYFFIFSDRRSAPGATKIALAFAHSAQPGTSEQFGNMPSEKFEFADDEGFFHRLFTFKTNTRIYVLQTVSSQKDDPLSERFFAKLQIGKILPADPSIQQTDSSAAVETAAITKPSQQTGNGSGSGTGSGSGPGSGGGIGNGNPQPEVRPATASMVIFAKPRPSYTDLARFYGITGAVRTRVTFLQNGTIGSVEPITKLPFGLTKSAVAAAKSIQFSPAMRDGKPVNTTKLVEYQFSIY